jgi:hypothetical protein
MGTFRPEVRKGADERLASVLINLDYEEDRVSRMGFGAKVELLLDHYERDNLEA